MICSGRFRRWLWVFHHGDNEPDDSGKRNRGISRQQQLPADGGVVILKLRDVYKRQLVRLSLVTGILFLLAAFSVIVLILLVRCRNPQVMVIFSILITVLSIGFLIYSIYDFIGSIEYYRIYQSFGVFVASIRDFVGSLLLLSLIHI